MGRATRKEVQNVCVIDRLRSIYSLTAISAIFVASPQSSRRFGGWRTLHRGGLQVLPIERMARRSLKIFLILQNFAGRHDRHATLIGHRGDGRIISWSAVRLPREFHIMWNWMMLGLESNRVIGLRIAKLMRGGRAAQREAQRMVSEKVIAAAKAGTSLMAGASGDKIVKQYRRKVAANAKRLSRKRTRRKRK